MTKIKFLNSALKCYTKVVTIPDVILNPIKKILKEIIFAVTLPLDSPHIFYLRALSEQSYEPIPFCIFKVFSKHPYLFQHINPVITDLIY